MSTGWLKRIALKNSIEHREDVLISITADAGHDLLEEATALIQPLFGDCELTLVDDRREIVYSTNCNEECLEDIKNRIQRFYDTNGIITGNQCRNGVSCSEWVVLPGNTLSYALFIEHYGKNDGLALRFVNQQILPMYSIAVKVSVLQKQSRDFLSVDERTMLPNRDALIQEMALRKDCHLGLLKIDNFSIIYGKTKGRGIKKLQVEMASVIRQDVKMAYLVGEDRFGMFLSGTLDEGLRFLQMLVGRIEEHFAGDENSPIISGTLCEQVGDPYATLFMCESYLVKSLGKVVILRERKREADTQRYEAISGDEVIDVEED